MYFLLLLFSLALFSFVVILRGNTALQSTHKLCDAQETFHSWRDANPYIYLGLSDTGKELLTKLIVAYDAYLGHHSYIKDNGYRDFLISLFDDVPPKPHKPNPPNVPSKTPATVGVLYLSLYKSCAIIAPTYVKR